MGIVPAIGRRSRWGPPAGAALDWNHPLSQGLVGFWTGDGTDPTGKLPLVPSGATRDVGQFGDGAVMVTTGANMSAVALPEHKVGPPISIVVVYTKLGVAAVDNCPLFGLLVNNANSPYAAYSVWSAGGSGNLWAMANNAGVLVTGAQVPLANGAHVVVVTFTPSTIDTWLDAKRSASAAVTVNPTFPGTCLIATGAVGGRANTTLNCTFHAGSIYNRILSANEIAMLAADPFCMFQS